MKYLLIILNLVLLSGCDIFNAREAEAPTQPRSNNQQAVTPEILIDNLINALKDKDAANYINCFSDTSFSNKKFVFSASSGASSLFPALSSDWGLQNEQQYFNNVKAKVPEQAQIILTFSKATQSPQGYSLIFTAEYVLNVPHTDNDPTVYQGDLIFSMGRDSRSVWTVYFWQDNKSTALPTWSELKGRFY